MAASTSSGSALPRPSSPVRRRASWSRRCRRAPRSWASRFLAAVGYGPKTFQRIARFQRLLALGRSPGSRVRVSAQLGQLGALALAAGYADQAHMTRDVRELAGRTPSMLLGHSASTLEMSELFKTTVERTP